MEDAVGRRSRSLAQQGSARALSAGLDGEADGRAVVPRSGARSQCLGQLRGWPARGQPRVPLLEPPGPRRDQHGQGHLPVVRRVLLSLRATDGHGRDRGDGQAAGVGTGISAARRRAILLHGARSRLEAAQVQAALGDLRHGERHHRPGLHAGEPAAAGGHGLAHRLRPRTDAAPVARPARTATQVHGLQAGTPRLHPRGDERSRQRAWHRRQGAPAHSQRADGGQDRDGAGRRPQHRQRQGRAVEAP